MHLNLDMHASPTQNGGFAIADLQQPETHIKTEHLADGNFAITIKKNSEGRAAGALATTGSTTGVARKQKRQGLVGKQATS